ncbi:MAG: DUF2333 family protein [Agarilytica sp.]
MRAITDKSKELWHTFSSRVSEWRADLREANVWFQVGLGVVAVYVLIAVVVGFFWSGEPELFSVREKALVEVSEDETKLVTGVHTTSALIHVVEAMLHKRGGYLTNDVSLPGVYLDNIPNWEYGVLIQVRDLTKAMRESFSRSQSQSLEDPNLASAEPQFNFSNSSWILPQTEKEYQDGVEDLRDYLASLTDGSNSNTQFYARADNLRYWLSTVETRLGALSQMLSASVGSRRLNTDLAGEPEASQSTNTPREVNVKTPWLDIDDNFFQARGSTWALIHFLKAVEIDFGTVLEKKNAKVSLQQIIRELEATQHTVYSPLILNGDGFGVLANHSLVMASYISRANAALIDLRELLSQG